MPGVRLIDVWYLPNLVWTSKESKGNFTNKVIYTVRPIIL